MRPNIRCAIAILTGALIPIAAFADTTNNVTGHVRTGEAPISLSTVTLYRTGDQKSSGGGCLGIGHHGRKRVLFHFVHVTDSCERCSLHDR